MALKNPRHFHFSKSLTNAAGQQRTLRQSYADTRPTASTSSTDTGSLALAVASSARHTFHGFLQVVRTSVFFKIFVFLDKFP